jgi:hypothetical protein
MLPRLDGITLKGCRRIKYNDSNTKSAYLLESTSIKKIIIINKKKIEGGILL